MQALTRRATKRLSKRKEAPTPIQDGEVKQRPNLLQKRTSSADALSKSKEDDPPRPGTTRKRRFSLKEVARKLLGKKSSLRPDKKSPVHTVDSAPIEIAPKENGTANGTTENESHDSGHDAGQDAGRDIGSNELRLRDVAHQRGISMTSTLTTLSNNSANMRLTSTLSPRPVGSSRPVRRISNKEHKPQNPVPDSVEIMFEGAPVFFINESKGIYGEPTVRYMDLSSGAQEHSMSFCEDAKGIDHEAFHTCSHKKPQDALPAEEQHHWLSGPSETPSMLSAFGLEPGSTGWQYYLEAQMVDLELEQGNTTGEIDEYGHDFYAPDSIGVRSIDSTTMIDRLRSIGKYHEREYQLEGEFETEERSLYGQLFTQLLYPARRGSNRVEEQDYALGSQCRELFKVLEERRVWLDFSRPEERIRLGSIIFGAGEEKLLLVLQILVSCELWLRLKILHRHSPQKLELESLYFTPKVNWDLVVAQKWLANVKIVERPYTPDFDMLTPPPVPQKPSGWQNFFFGEEARVEDAEEPQDADTYDAYFVPQDLERQLNGLLFFARKINWPGIEMLEGVIRDKLRDTAGLQTPSIAYKTPATSPGKMTPRSIGGASRGSYFGYVTNKHTSSAIVRNISQGGWLSRTYNTGMILPGEGLSHLLMGSLLENDTLALNEVGEQGSMYGGIIRRTLEASGSTASWWSTNNIVGKVLATDTSPQSYAGWVGKCVGIFSSKGTTFEDMAQMSTVAAKVMRNFVLTPQTNTEKNGMKLVEPIGWVDVVTDRKPGKRTMPRLSKPTQIELESEFKVPEASSDQQGRLDEFEFPHVQAEQSYGIQVLGLKFWDKVVVSSSVLPELEEGYYYRQEGQNQGDFVPAYRVEAVFKFPGVEQSYEHLFDSAEEDIVGLFLQYDVAFVTSYPCKPGTTSNPSSTFVETGISEFKLQEGRGHPLHSSYKYKVIKLEDLPTHTIAKRNESTASEHFVTVINALGNSEALYVYAKAWCAKWGTDAIVSRPGRTCLSCAIREASALGIDVIICVGET